MGCSNCCDSNDITLPEGQDGVGISSITLNGSNQFVINYTNGTSATTSAVTITATGTNILHNDTTLQTDTLTAGAAAALITGKTYTLPLNTVTTNGSEIRATAWLSASLASGYNHTLKFYIYCNGAWFSVNSPDGGYYADAGVQTITHKIEFTLTRKSNTTVAASFNAATFVKTEGLEIISFADFTDTPASLGVFDFTTTAIDFEVYAEYSSTLSASPYTANTNTQAVTCDKFIVEHYKK